ncbi:MAG TPA: FkbM family methyltransferase [Allosphingosinicella sp.]|jgi:FkbM family methyltransferase
MIRNLADAARHVARTFVTNRRRRAFAKRGEAFVHTTAQGNRFELYPGEFIDRDIYAFGIYERRILDLLRARLKRRRTYLDIGANIGNHALYLRDIFEHVHCFDPNPVIVRRLRRNIALNEATNITVHPVGLGDVDGELPFNADVEGNMGLGSFVHQGAGEPVMLPVIAASRYIGEQKIEGIDFVKVDVEGFEPQVFLGLRETIAIHRPVVAFEYHGGMEPIESWETITASMPGYVFVDAIPPAPAGLAGKLAFALRHGMNPPMAPIAAPGNRSYAAVLGFPSREALAEFEA